MRRLTVNGVFQEIHSRPKRGVTLPDLFAYMNRYASQFIHIMEQQHDGFNGKYQARAHVVFVKFSAGDTVERADPWLVTEPLENTDGFEDLMSRLCLGIALAYSNVALERSGWAFEMLLQFDINRARYQIVANRGNADKPPKLPKGIHAKAVVQVARSPIAARNIGNNCFVDAISIAIYIARHGGRDMRMPEHGYRTSTWMGLVASDPLNLTFHERLASLTGGVDAKDIYLFENDNPQYFVSVLSTNGKDGFHSARQFKYSHYKEAKQRGDSPIVVHLLLYGEHYFPVRSLDCLLRHNVNQHFCSFCLHPFRNAATRDTHMETCDTLFTQQYKMPREGSEESFMNHLLKCQYHPYAIYADIESYHETELPSDEELDDTQPPPKKKKVSATTILDRHRPYLASYYLAFTPCFIEKLEAIADLKKLLPEYPNNLYKEFVGDGCIESFVKDLLDLSFRLHRLFKFHNRFDYDPVIADFLDNDECNICTFGYDKHATEPGLVAVRDHDHWRGNMRGWAHSGCNLEVRQLRRFTPIIMHNFKGYDGHMICKYLKFNKEHDVELSPIATTAEKYLSLSLRIPGDTFTSKEGKEITLKCELRFLDSLQFLSCSLATLIDQLKASNNAALFHHTNKVLRGNQALLEISQQKGVYPHDYITSLEVLSETCLPPKRYFPSGLNSAKGITDSDYAYAQEVWDKTGCATLWDYARQYCRIDVVGLADVFENFRLIALRDYCIDPVLCYSLPNFAWAAMLRKTGIHLELVCDYELYCVLRKAYEAVCVS